MDNVPYKLWLRTIIAILHLQPIPIPMAPEWLLLHSVALLEPPKVSKGETDFPWGKPQALQWDFSSLHQLFYWWRIEILSVVCCSLTWRMGYGRVSFYPSHPFLPQFLSRTLSSSHLGTSSPTRSSYQAQDKIYLVWGSVPSDTGCHRYALCHVCSAEHCARTQLNSRTQHQFWR